MPIYNVQLGPENFTAVRRKIKQSMLPAPDYFKGGGFEAHRNRIAADLDGLAADLEAAPDRFGILVVLLRAEALEESRRPYRLLFHPERMVSAGGLRVGELLFEAPADRLTALATEVRTEGAARQLKAQAQRRMRSEIGSIESVRLYGAGDKHRFSDADLRAELSSRPKWFHYSINMFHGNRGLVDSFYGRLEAYAADRCVSMDVHEEPPSQWSLSGRLHLGLRLHTGPGGLVRADWPAETAVPGIGPTETDAAAQLEFLRWLEAEPCVRDISLPAQFVLS